MTEDGKLSSTTIIGLDIGDGESALAYLAPLDDSGRADPAMIHMRRKTRERNIITAVGRSAATGRRLIGEEAVSATGAVQFSVNFKTPPDPGSFTTPDSILFAQALLDEFLQETGISRERCLVYVGHPTGWTEDAVQAYARHFGSLQVPVQLIPESHSALIHVRDRRATGSSWNTSALVIDIGSSTIDCTLVDDMVAHNLALGQSFGCQQIDRALARQVTSGLKDKQFHDALATDGGPELLLLACRRVKEAYFTGTRPRLLMFGDDSANPRFDPIIDQAFGWLRGIEISEIINAPDGWRCQFLELLEDVRDQISGHLPQLIVLSGGGSRMGFVREVVREIFPDAEIENDPEPSFSVARGLVSNARHRRNVTQFRQRISEITRDTVISSAVTSAMDAMVSEFKSKLMEIDAPNRGEAVRVAKQISTSSSGAFRSTSPSEVIINFDHYVTGINNAIEHQLSPHITEICRQYGVEEYALTFSVQFPRLITGDLAKLLNTAVNGATLSPEGVQAGSHILKVAFGKAITRSPLRPSKLDAAGLIISGTILAGATIGAIAEARRAHRTATHLDLDLIQIQPGEAERFTESVREQVESQLTKRADEVERFLA